MMNVQELLWKYAEGKCDPKEKTEVKKLISADPALKRDLESIREVNTALAKMELEQPSMRFVQNVMEALPKVSFSSQPLLSPFWKKTLWGVLAVSIVSVFFLSSRTSSSGGYIQPYAEKIITGIGGMLEAVPAGVMQYFVVIFLAATALVVLDKMLSRRMNLNLF